MPRLRTVRPSCNVRPLDMTRLKAQSRTHVAEANMPLHSQHHCWPACLSIGLQCTERLGHLRMCIEPDWRSFGDGKATAASDLTLLVKQLRCWDKPEQPLQLHEAVCLARGATAILRAVHNAGGASTLAAAEPSMAVCLGYSLVQSVSDLRRHWVPDDVCRCVQDAFAVLGPHSLQSAAEGLLQGTPGSPQRACIAALLTYVFMQIRGRPVAEDAENSNALAQLAVYQQQVNQHSAIPDICVLALTCCWHTFSRA